MSSSRLLVLRRKFSNIVQANTQKAQNSIGSTELPVEKKESIIKKWFKYWRQLGLDYKDVAVDTGREVRTKPVKAGIIGSVIFTGFLAANKNPDEASFIDVFRTYNADMMLVHQSCQNPAAAQYLKFLEQCYNEGILRRLSLGVVSLIWLDNYDRSLAIYKAMCPYLKPEYLQFSERIVDIGFWNKWWKLDQKMIDYDVNI